MGVEHVLVAEGLQCAHAVVKCAWGCLRPVGTDMRFLLPSAMCRARREEVLKQATAAEGAADDGTYKGMNAYVDYRKVRGYM